MVTVVLPVSDLLGVLQVNGGIIEGRGDFPTRIPQARDQENEHVDNRKAERTDRATCAPD
jgi:hypothetical protein